MYYERTAESVIKKAGKYFGAVLVTGARQVGKSTLLKHCGPTRNYVTLDDPSARELAVNDPRLFMQRHPAPVIIDEIQYAPDILTYIKMEIDSKRSRGAYWLTGSQQFHMMKNVSESLAGRIAIIDLAGFSLNELGKRPERAPFLPLAKTIAERRKTAKRYGLRDIYEIMHRGSFPAINVEKRQDWEMFYSAYLQTYLERDIRDLIKISDEMVFLKFIRAVAARTGQMLNYADIAAAIGISQPTAKSWLSLLVSSRMVYLLEPYYENITKRMIKTPKIYFTDTGLCSYLTGWNTPEVLERGAMSGAMFETFIVNEILKGYLHNGKKAPIYYYRDKDKREIDLILERGGKLHPVEIKKTAKPGKADIKNFSVLPNGAEGAVICLCAEDTPLTKTVNAIPAGYV